MQDYLWNQPHSTRSLGRDFRLRRGAGHGLVAAANAAGFPAGAGGGYGVGAYGGNGLSAAGRSRSLGAGINREDMQCCQLSDQTRTRKEWEDIINGPRSFVSMFCSRMFRRFMALLSLLKSYILKNVANWQPLT